MSIVRRWGPAVIVQKIDGKDAGVRGTESHAYVLPGDHEFEIKLMRIRGYHLLCGALCDAIFEDRGTSYDPVCLDPRNYRDGENC